MTRTTMMPTTTRVAITTMLLALALAGGCSAESYDDPSDTTTAGDGDTGDGDGDGDPGGCEMQFSYSPVMVEAGMTVVLDGEILASPGLNEYFEWAVLFSNEPVAVTPRQPDNRSVEFVADRAGQYMVNLRGGVRGIDCSASSATINVTEPGASRRSYELRVVAPTGTALRERRTISVPVGSSFDLGVVSLEPGIPVAGTVVGPDGPVSAYLRATPSGGGPAPEAFATGDGRFELRMGAEDHDLLIVPSGTALAPALLRDRSPGELTGDQVLDEGETFAGVVRDSLGEPVVGARVSIASDGVPSTVGVVGLDGSFELRARPVRLAGATTLAMAEPRPVGDGGGADAALVRLRLPAAAGWVPGTGPLAIDYQPGFARRQHSFRIALPDDAPAAGARLVLRSLPVAGAARIADGGAEFDASAVARFEARADESGLVGPVTLPDAIYEVVVLPPAGADAAARVVTLDLEDGAPAPETITLAAGYRLSGDITGTSAVVHVTARPRDGLAADVLSVEAASAAGSYELDLAPDLDYVVSVAAPPSSLRTPARFPVSAGGDGEEGERGVSLGAANELRGTVELPGVGGLFGAHVALYCVVDCFADSDPLLAEAVTGAGGRFALNVPDSDSD